jgi:hypothetical protein
MTSVAEEYGHSTTIPLPRLLELHNIGFKLVPLKADSKTPNVYSTNEIYNNPNYWTIERLEQEYYRFKNVATVFGLTHIRDREGKDASYR